MRPDMNKLITECYRINSEGRYSYKYHRNKTKKTPLEERLEKEPIKWASRYWIQKEFGENLAPLKRYIEKQIGRPWDKVRSEMNENLSINSTIDMHVWQHVEDYIEEKTICDKKGKVFFYPEYFHYSIDDTAFEGAIPLKHSWSIVYVCPKNGCLKKNKDYKNALWKRPEFPKLNRVIVDTAHQLHQIFGVWYEITLKECDKRKFKKVEFYPYYVFGKNSKDVATKSIRMSLKIDGHHVIDLIKIYGRDDVFAYKKEQLSTSKLKKYGLKNKIS